MDFELSLQQSDSFITTGALKKQPPSPSATPPQIPGSTLLFMWPQGTGSYYTLCLFGARSARGFVFYVLMREVQTRYQTTL